MHLFLRSAIRLVSVLFGIPVLVFLIVHAIPGDPAVIAAGMEASQETVERIRRDLGLDQPLATQFVRFVTSAAAGDLGTSIRSGAPVVAEIRERSAAYRDGRSLFDLNGAALETMRELASDGDGWRIPPMPTPPDTYPADVEWLTARRVDMPIKCFEQKLTLQHGETCLPRSYIYATRTTQADPFGQFAMRIKNEPGWRYLEIDASHSPNVTAPETLMALLMEIVS